MTLKGIFYLSVALLTFAFSHITDKLGINNGVDPAVFSLFRAFFGLLIVAAVWFSLRKRKKLIFKKKYLKNLIIIGLISTGLGLFLAIKALSYTTATNKGIMQGMYTAFTLIFAYFILHERLPKLFYPVFVTMVVGLIMLTSKGLLQLPNKGDWILFLTVPMIGFCNVYAKGTMKKLPSLTVSFGRYIFGTLFLLLLLPLAGIDNLETLRQGIIWVIFSGILSGVRVIAFYKGIEIEGPTIAATMLTVAPAVTAISSFLILKETFNFLQLIGLTLVLGGALLITQLRASYKEA